MSFDPIQRLVQAELEATDATMGQHLGSNVPLIGVLTHYVIGAKGKRIRPVMVHLLARALAFSSSHTAVLASIVELIHTATLLHDDVVDQSTQRRGQLSANSRFGNPASVLVGDFLYSRTFQMMASLQRLDLMDVFAQATNAIAEGEVLQLSHVRQHQLSQAEYFRQIEAKTATLFEAAAHAVALLAACDAPTTEALRRYGRQLGIAFQIADDLLDYTGEAAQMGKNLGDDLNEGKVTLPLILALQRQDPSAQERTRLMISAQQAPDLAWLKQQLEDTGALADTRLAAQQAITQAQAATAALSPSPYRDALGALAAFSLERTS